MCQLKLGAFVSTPVGLSWRCSSPPMYSTTMLAPVASCNVMCRRTARLEDRLRRAADLDLRQAGLHLGDSGEAWSAHRAAIRRRRWSSSPHRARPPGTPRGRADREARRPGPPRSCRRSGWAVPGRWCRSRRTWSSRRGRRPRFRRGRCPVTSSFARNDDELRLQRQAEFHGPAIDEAIVGGPQEERGAGLGGRRDQRKPRRQLRRLSKATTCAA